MAAAADSATPSAVRIAAVGALGRIMHSHDSFAEQLLPALLALARGGTAGDGVGGGDNEEAQGEAARQEREASGSAVRRASLLVFASLLPVVPALTEPHALSVLRAALAPREGLRLRLAALGALSDLLGLRKLQVASSPRHRTLESVCLETVAGCLCSSPLRLASALPRPAPPTCHSARLPRAPRSPPRGCRTCCLASSTPPSPSDSERRRVPFS